MSSQDDTYPEAWRPPHLRRADADAQAQRDAAQAQQAQDTLNRTTSGCGGHLGAIGLAAAAAYPAEWRSHTPKGTQRQ